MPSNILIEISQLTTFKEIDDNYLHHNLWIYWIIQIELDGQADYPQWKIP